MKMIRLTPKWAKKIAQVEARVYSPDFQCGEEDFEEDLEAAEEEDENFSLGMIDDQGKLVAYLIAYIEESEQYGDPVVYGSDIAVLPHYENRGLADQLVLGLLKLLNDEQVRLPIEGECREGSYRMIADHPRVFSRYGYQLGETKILPCYNAGEDHWWIRLECI